MRNKISSLSILILRDPLDHACYNLTVNLIFLLDVTFVLEKYFQYSFRHVHVTVARRKHLGVNMSACI
jgi:hypothetical protein